MRDEKLDVVIEEIVGRQARLFKFTAFRVRDATARGPENPETQLNSSSTVGSLSTRPSNAPSSGINRVPMTADTVSSARLAFTEHWLRSEHGFAYSIPDAGCCGRQTRICPFSHACQILTCDPLGTHVAHQCRITLCLSSTFTPFNPASIPWLSPSQAQLHPRSPHSHLRPSRRQ